MQSRRQFIKNASCAAIGGITMGSTLLNFRSLNAAVQNNAQYLNNDYRALVCILLAGGNDSYNMLIPADSTATNSQYDIYKKTRSNLALPFANVLKSASLQNNSKPLGLHPSLTSVKQMYDSGELALVANVGTLVEPVSTVTQIRNKTKKAPLGLYSHSDQIYQWQTGVPHERSNTGWGGKIADLVHSCNTGQDISMNISLSGTNIFQTGTEVVEYSINPYNGVVTINNDGGTWALPQIIKNSLDSMLYKPYADAYKKTYVDITRNSREGAALLKGALATAPAYTTPFVTSNSLSRSLKYIADVIATRSLIGHNKRQIFFVEYGGWDHHDEVLDNQNVMLGIVNQALDTFNKALKQINMFNCVTTFTMSEFARTLTSNGNGTDHGWGGNVMVMGGDVNGNAVYGNYPSLALRSTIDLGNGVLIPSTSTDQYFSELALWFGLAPSDLPLIYPNVGNFYSYGTGNLPLGFMKSRGSVCN